SADIGRLSTEVADARGRADKAQQSADTAQTAANNAGQRADTAIARADTIDKKVDSIVENIDAFSLKNTVTVTFKPGSAKLDAEAIAALDALAEEYKGKNGFLFEIQGF